MELVLGRWNDLGDDNHEAGKCSVRTCSKGKTWAELNYRCPKRHVKRHLYVCTHLIHYFHPCFETTIAHCFLDGPWCVVCSGCLHTDVCHYLAPCLVCPVVLYCFQQSADLSKLCTGHCCQSCHGSSKKSTEHRQVCNSHLCYSLHLCFELS